MLFLLSIDVSHNPYHTSHIPFTLISSNEQLLVFYVVHKDMCCLRPDVRCEYDTQDVASVGSCTSLLASLWLQVVLTFIAVFVLLANVFRGMSWIEEGKLEWKSRHILSCGLNLADSLMAVYLATILTVNIVHYNNVSFVALK